MTTLRPAVPPKHGYFATAAAIFFVFLWASAYVPSKIAATESSPYWFLAARFLGAGLILVVLALVTRRAWPRTLRGWLVCAALGIFANALYLGLTYTALRHLSSGVGAIVASTNPLVLALLAPSLLGEPLTPTKLAGSLLGFAGVVAIVIVRMGTKTAQPLDVAIAIGGVLANVASTLIFKRLAVREDLLVVTAIQMVAAGLAMIPAALVFEPAGPPQLQLGISPELWASYAYLVLVLSVGASLLWFWLLTHGEASRVSAFYYLTPAFGLALSALFLHESIGLRDLFGLGAIAAGIALVHRPESAGQRRRKV